MESCIKFFFLLFYYDIHKPYINVLCLFVLEFAAIPATMANFIENTDINQNIQ